MPKQTINKFREKKYAQIKVRLNSHEYDLLDMLMSNEGWSNTSGFIKYKLFGFVPDVNRKRMIRTSTKDDILQSILRKFQQFHNDLVYAAISYDINYTSLFSSFTADEKKKQYNRWCALLKDYYKRIHNEIIDLWEVYNELLPLLSGHVIQQYDELDSFDRAAYVRVIPSEILMSYAEEGWLMDPNNKDLLNETFRRLNLKRIII